MIIRKATAADAQAIADCLLLAMEVIVYVFIGERDRQKAREFLHFFARKEGNQYSYQNCLVMEYQNKIVAAVNVYDGAQLAQLRQPVLERIRNYYNQTITPEDETGPGEYYIDSLGVLPEFQGQGIGVKLLQFLIEEYVTKQGRTLGLLVDKENPKAKRLYQKSGFQPVSNKFLLGKEMDHLQLKPSK